MDGSDDEIEAEMLKDENIQRRIEGREPLGLRNFGFKLHQRIDRLSATDLEDIGEQAVANAEQRIKRKRNRSFKEQVVFTGYWRRGTTKIYGFKRPSSEIMSLRIKGGPHRVVDIQMSSYDRRSYTLETARMMGYAVRKRRGRKGWDIYVGSK